MSSANYGALRQAILERQQLRLECAGERYVVCPHVLGWQEDGREHVLTYVLRCGPPSRSIGAWRCFDVEAVGEIRDDGPGWVTSRDGRPARCVDRVDVEAAAIPRTGRKKRKVRSPRKLAHS